MLEQKFKDRRKSGTKNYIRYKITNLFCLSKDDWRGKKKSWTILSCKYLVLHYFGEFITVGKKQDMVHDRVEITRTDQ